MINERADVKWNQGRQYAKVQTNQPNETVLEEVVSAGRKPKCKARARLLRIDLDVLELDSYFI